MDNDDFRVYLIAASYWAIQVAQRYVKEKLLYDFVYDVELNQSMDEGCGDDFVCYPKDEGKVFLQQNVNEVVALLVRDGRVPTWIDINVKSVTKKTTTLRLRCAGRFTNKRDRLIYHASGQGSFGIKSPYLPFDLKEGQKFRLTKKATQSFWSRLFLK